MAMNNFVHTPSETASHYVKFAKEMAENPGISFGCSLDDHLLPQRPGKTIGLLGRPGHNKTSLGGYFVLNEGLRIIKHGLQDKFYSVHVSWEQPVEELEAMYERPIGYGVTDIAWGRVPIKKVVMDFIKRPALPVWLFGDSLYKTDLDTPPMTIEVVYNAIQGIWKERGMLPSLIFFDYIQDIPVPSEKDRYMQVSSAMRKVKRLAIQVSCPVILGIQANQRTDDYDQPIPSMRDAEWSAVISQKLDALLALWKPIRTWLPTQREHINIGGTEYPNTENLMVIKLLKQRFEKGYGIWAFDFDPNAMLLKDYEMPKASPAWYK